MRHDDMGGSAFPRRLPDVKVAPDEAIRIIEQCSGMTLWDYYAAAALTGLASDYMDHNGEDEICSQQAALIADAMLAERKKRMGGSDDAA